MNWLLTLFGTIIGFAVYEHVANARATAGMIERMGDHWRMMAELTRLPDPPSPGEGPETPQEEADRLKAAAGLRRIREEANRRMGWPTG